MNPFDSGSPRHTDFRDVLHDSHAAPAEEASEARFVPCHIMAPDVVAYFDGEADDQAALRARRHLDACPECARMWRDWGDARLTLRTDRLPEMPVHWPASLVQRARLQAMLPSLFEQPVSAPGDASEAPEEVGFLPPADLRSAIFAKTTRAPLAAIEPQVQHLEETPHAARKPSRIQNCYRTLTRSCVPALAAWIMVLASAPPVSAPVEPLEDAASVQAPAPNAASEPSHARRVADATSRRQLAGETSESEPLAFMGEVLRHSVAANESIKAAAREPEAKPIEKQAALSPIEQPRKARTREIPERPAVDEARVRPEPRLETRASWRETASRSSKAAPAEDAASTSAPQARAAEPPVAPVVRLVAKPEPKARPELEKRPAREIRAENLAAESSAEHEPLGVVRELNDTRPAEIGDAIDAYAATWIDEGDLSP